MAQTIVGCCGSSVGPRESARAREGPGYDSAIGLQPGGGNESAAASGYRMRAGQCGSVRS